MGGAEARVYAVLDQLGIPYVRHEHPPVFTVEKEEQLWTDIEGLHCKNLFLRNKKGNRHYLVVAPTSKTVDLRRLNEKLGEDRLSFGSPERLIRLLGLEPGSVSPFGLINDRQKEVMVILDEELRSASRVNFHPNVNTATVGLSRQDFEKFLAWTGNSVRYFEL